MEIANHVLSNATTCFQNCGSHGECVKGTCICYVQFSGWFCRKNNLPYYISFSAIFYLICVVAFGLLVLRMRSEFRRTTSSLVGIFKLDIQKLLYFFVICATGSRAVYFLLGMQNIMPPFVANILFSMFYPFMLSGFSLIICFWAESFHLTGLELDKPRFLTKSVCGFVLFNFTVYSAFVGLVVANILQMSIADEVNKIFNICVAFLVFLTLVLFLVYGIEIFYKMKGAFKKSESIADRNRINYQQLFQSRMGLMFEAVFQLVLVSLLLYEVAKKMYKINLTVFDANLLKIIFHLIELGSIMWFPCCLWNFRKPGRLWILNPQNLFTRLQEDKESSRLVAGTSSYNTFKQDSVQEVANDVSVEHKTPSDDLNEMDNSALDCWICLSNERRSDMIQPCNCKGGTSLVHHDCLRTWIMEKAPSDEVKNRPTCDICKAEYHVMVNKSFVLLQTKEQCLTWSKSIIISSILLLLPVCLYFVWYRVQNSFVKLGVFAILLIFGYILLKIFGLNFLKAYRISKRRALIILDSPEAPNN